MPLEISEDIVSLAYQNLGYFVIEGRKVGRREIDLLAIRLGDDGQVAERLHIEISVSTNPVGVLRPESSLRSGSDPMRAAEGWARKKFDSVATDVEKAFGSKDYRKVFVHGAFTKKAQPQFAVLAKCGVTCRPIADLVKDARKGGATNRLQRACEIADLLVRPNDQQD